MKKRDLIYHCSLHSKWTKRGYTPKDVFPYSSLAYYRFVMNEYAKGTLFIFPKPTVRNAKLNEVVFIAHLFTPKGLMISQYSQFLFNQMFEPYSDKEIQEIINKIKNKS